MAVNPYILIICLILACVACKYEEIPGDGMGPGGQVEATFEFAFGGGIKDSATAIVENDDGDFFITGQRESNWVLVYKTNGAKDELVYKKEGEVSGEALGYDIINTGDGGALVAGEINTLFERSSYVLKLNSAGNTVDSWKFTDNKGISITVANILNGGGFLLGGHMRTAGDFFDKNDTYFVKLNSSLNPTQTVHFTDNTFDSNVVAVFEMGNGDLIGVGSRWVGFGMRINFAKSNAGGTTKTQSSLTFQGIGGDNNVNVNAAIQSSDGNIVIAGNVRLLLGNSVNTYLKKIDGNGSDVWEWSSNYIISNASNISGNNIPSAVIQTGDSGFLIVGNHKLNSTSDIFMLKTDENGAYEWDRSYGGSGADVINDVIELQDGSFLLAGYTESFNTSGEAGNIYLLKTDSNGNIN